MASTYNPVNTAAKYRGRNTGMSGESEPESFNERILNEPDGVYRFVITPDGKVDRRFDQSQKLEIIRF